MSGRATGWVLRNGPHPEHVGPDGKRYGQRARGLRMVLLAVADAANSDGEHAYPGVDNVARASLYSRRQAISLLADLVAHGWLEVEAEGGGRGHATTYRMPFQVPVDRAATAPIPPPERVQPPHPPAGGKGATGAQERVQSGPETVQPGLHPNGSTNGELPTEQPPADAGAAVVHSVYAAKKAANHPPPAVPFPGLVKIARQLLAAGWPEPELVAAMAAVPTISTRWVEAELVRRRGGTPGSRQQGRAVDTDRDEPTGRLDL